MVTRPKAALILPARGTRVCPSLKTGLVYHFSESRLRWFLEDLGWTCLIPSLKAKVWFASLTPCAAPAPEEGGVCAKLLGQLSGPPDLHRFSLFFSRNQARGQA